MLQRHAAAAAGAAAAVATAVEEVMAARAGLEAARTERDTRLVGVGSLEEEVGDVKRRLGVVENEKKVAAAARDFKRAAQLAVETR